MKNIFALFICFLASCASFVSAQQSNETLWTEANGYYEEGEYAKAINGYNQILESGVAGEDLYFNLANAYFKSDSVAKAIVNYRRALNIDPTDEDIAYNLEVARSKTVNKIDEVPTFFLIKWVERFVAIFTSNVWAVISLVAFAVMLVFLASYFLSNTAQKRKVSFTISAISLFVFIVALSNSVATKRNVIDSRQAVVVSSATSVKSSPSNSGKDLFILNEGVEVETLEQVGDYTEIVLVSGNKGWIKTSAIEII